MDRSVADQEKEVKDMLRRAKGTPDRHGSLRRETFRRLIDLAHSDHTVLKILSAGNMRLFLTDFPDLEEAAIDAIYDLCEDSSSKVRIEGYHAIIQVSKVQSKWIKRNADVLVQLLQSEEADEVVIVKKALTEHLDMDPKITLGVLYDQIIPRDDTTDEEDIYIRERLRSLVLAFMAGEAKRAICERHAIPGASGEPVLYEGLFAAIPRLGIDDLQLIIKDLVYALPAFKDKWPNERGSELLQLLLSEKAAPALKADLHSVPTDASLVATRPLLEICEHIACVLRVAPAIDLLQLYCASLIGKITLQKMKLTEQQWIVCSLARVLDVAEKQDQNMRLPSLRRTIIDACPYLLEVLKKSNLSEPSTVTSYGVFLRACLQRTKESSWTAPPHLLGILQELNRQPEISQNEEYERLFRSLALPSQQSQTTLPTTSLSASPSASGPHTPPILPSRPPTLLNVNLHPNMSRSVHTQTISPAQDATRVKRDTTVDTRTSRPMKRPKVDEEVVGTQKGPTLLSRLGTSISRQSSRSDLSSRTPSASPKPEGDSLSQPGHGFSIKGAAAKQARQNGSASSGAAPSSLLERLQDPYPRASGAQHHQPDIGRKRRNF